MPDFADLRRERGWSALEVGGRLGLLPSHYHAIEQGWKDLTLSELLWCAEQLDVPLGAFFHNLDFVMRPMTRTYDDYWRDSMDQHLI